MKRPLLRRATTGVVAAALVAVAGLVPAQATDVESVRARARTIAAEVTRLERRLAGLNDRRAELDDRIAAVTQSIARYELEIKDAEAAHDAALDRYIARAVEAYKSGPLQDLALLLSADNITEAATALEAGAARSRLDAEVVADLESARSQAERAQARIDRSKQMLLADRARIRSLTEQVGGTVAERSALLDRLDDQVARLEAQARRQAARAAFQVPTAIAGSGPGGPARGIPKGFASSGVAFEGVASWYGPGFERNHTANGEIFDSSLYTAASKELPFGTWLYVEHEGRGVVVRINDRGPFVGDRILDLSRAAAYSIGITGIGWVKATIIFKL